MSRQTIHFGVFKNFYSCIINQLLLLTQTEEIAFVTTVEEEVITVALINAEYNAGVPSILFAIGQKDFLVENFDISTVFEELYMSITEQKSDL